MWFIHALSDGTLANFVYQLGQRTSTLNIPFFWACPTEEWSYKTIMTSMNNSVFQPAESYFMTAKTSDDETCVMKCFTPSNFQL